MIQKSLKINSSIETREVALLVQTASKFSSQIKLELNSKKVNVKSIMGIIALGDLDGKEITIFAEGSDEKEAINDLCDFFAK